MIPVEYRLSHGNINRVEMLGIENNELKIFYILLSEEKTFSVFIFLNLMMFYFFSEQHINGM